MSDAVLHLLEGAIADPATLACAALCAANAQDTVWILGGATQLTQLQQLGVKHCASLPVPGGIGRFAHRWLRRHAEGTSFHRVYCWSPGCVKVARRVFRQAEIVEVMQRTPAQGWPKKGMLACMPWLASQAVQHIPSERVVVLDWPKLNDTARAMPQCPAPDLPVFVGAGYSPAATDVFQALGLGESAANGALLGNPCHIGLMIHPRMRDSLHLLERTQRLDSEGRVILDEVLDTPWLLPANALGLIALQAPGEGGADMAQVLALCLAPDDLPVIAHDTTELRFMLSDRPNVHWVTPGDWRAIGHAGWKLIDAYQASHGLSAG